MAALLVGLVLLLAMVGHSDGSYCVCNSNVSDSVLQKNIDYACGAGADCTNIHQNGACYNPNSVKDHCNFAVNSYYLKKGQIPGSCDFQGSATVTQTPPTNAVSGCVYQSSPRSSHYCIFWIIINGGSTSNGNSSSGGTLPGTTVSPNGSLGPIGSGFGTDNSAVF
ncbi:hypothetical protein OROGR_010220 [Orobanche gracilis]